MPNDNNGSFENMEPQTPTATPASSETSHVPKPLVDNVDDYEYIYVTEALSAYPNCYTTEWDDIFESARAPVCDDLSTYFFNPLKPQLPLNVLIPSEPQNVSDGSDNPDSSKLVVDEPQNNQVMDPIDAPADDSSLKPKKRGRPRKNKLPTTESELNQGPKRKRLPKSK